MARSAISVVVVIAICAGILAGAFALYRYYTSPEQAARRREHALLARNRERFVACFDSLKEARLYPTAWRSGAFTKATLSETREKWTLTISSSDWERRDEFSKKDLIARLHTTFRGALAQAGGNPKLAVLIIESEDGQRLAECSTESGAQIHR